MGDERIRGDTECTRVCNIPIHLSLWVQVTFENPKWPKFISEMTQKACDALGVDYYACEPRCELHKLLLYEEGSQ